MLCHSSVCSRGGFNHGIIHVNSRFRRDARALEEEEETWFDQEDENGEEAVVMEQSDLLNDEHVFKNRKGFANEKPPPSLINNKRVSLWERWNGVEYTRADLEFWLGGCTLSDGNAQEAQFLYARQCIIHAFKRVRALV